MAHQLYFETTDGKKLFMEVTGEETMEVLRDKIEPALGVPLEQMTFTLADTKILHDHPLNEYNIEEFKIIYISSESDTTVKVGGALNTGNFRDNIYSGLLPQKSTITYESVFNEYSFENETTERDISVDKVSPLCSFARISNPITQEDELFMTLGFNTNMTQGSLKLDTLNVVVLIDTSHSMKEPLNGESEKTKYSVAAESVVDVLSRFDANNNLAIISYDEKEKIIQSIGPPPTGMEMVDLKEKILTITTTERCDLCAGFDAAVNLLHPFASSERENRIIVFTDKIPTNFVTDFTVLENIESAVSQKIYTTVVAVGAEINTDIRKAITAVKGANCVGLLSEADVHYYLSHLEYFMIPLALDLSVKVSSSDFEIEAVFGTSSKEAEKGSLNIPTLFPTPQDAAGHSTGGIVLYKLKPTADPLASFPTLQIALSYEARNGEQQAHTEKVDASQLSKEVFSNNKIRKAIALQVYVKALLSWVDASMASAAATRNVARKDKRDYYDTGKEGVPLKITPQQHVVLTTVLNYLQDEGKKLPDHPFDKEIQLLSFLLEKVAQEGLYYYETQTENDTCFIHAVNNYFQKSYTDEKFLSIYTELLRNSAVVVTKLKNTGSKASFYGNKTVYEKFLNDSNSEPMYDEDLFGYFEIYKSLQVEDFLDDIAQNKLKELTPIQALFLLEFSLNILPSAGGGMKALLYYTPHTFLHRYARNTSRNDQTLSQKRFCEAVKNSPKMFMCHIENGRSHAFSALNQLVPAYPYPSLQASIEMPNTPRTPLNLSGAVTPGGGTPGGTPMGTPRDTATTPRSRANSIGTPLSTTPPLRDFSPIPLDLDSPQPQPVSTPSKSLWSAVFGFALGPFASCMYPYNSSCIPPPETEEPDPAAVPARPPSPMLSLKETPTGQTNGDAATKDGSSSSGRSTPSNEERTENGHKEEKEAEWILLDSLVGTGLKVPDLKTFFGTFNYGGRASVLIAPDTTREPILIGRKNINNKP